MDLLIAKHDSGLVFLQMHYQNEFHCFYLEIFIKIYINIKILI